VRSAFGRTIRSASRAAGEHSSHNTIAAFQVRRFVSYPCRSCRTTTINTCVDCVVVSD
jgi:hypothetical protein